ncbi:hypothetical protein LINPERHAP1_LOCUS9809, partial [Linum perenne]
ADLFLHNKESSLLRLLLSKSQTQPQTPNFAGGGNMAAAGRTSYDNNRQQYSWIPAILDDVVCRRNHHQHQYQRTPVRNNKLQHVADSTTHQPLRARSSSSQRPSTTTSRRIQPAANKFNWAASRAGGGEMRAIFLDSGGKSSTGTGVFLPKHTGTTKNSPGCSPVLLPARVVQALNLNVNELGLQLTRRQSDSKHCSKLPGHCNNHTTPTPIVDPPNENASPELLLPKEWTY